MLPFVAVLLASPLALTEAPPPAAEAPGFDLTAFAFPALVAEDLKPEDYGKWHGSVSLGATFSDGNTDRTTFAATGKAENRREKDRTTFELLWNYAEEEDVITQRRTYGSAKYDYFVTKKLYYLGQVSGESDKNAALDLRMIYAVGAGYQFREDEVWKINGEAGLAWVDENYDVNSADAEYPAARLAYKADWTPNEKWAVGQAGQIYPSLEDSDDVNALVDTHAKLTLTEKLFAQLQWIYTWDNTPAPGKERVDNLLLLTLGWTF